MTRKCISCIYYSFLMRSNILRFMCGSDLLTHTQTHTQSHKHTQMPTFPRGYVIHSYDFHGMVFPLFGFIPSPAFSLYLLTALAYEMLCNSRQRFNLLLNLIKICLEFGVYLFCFVLSGHSELDGIE